MLAGRAPHLGMDDSSGMIMSGPEGDSTDMPLNHTGVDFGNATQAADFLSALLDDTELQIVGSQSAVYFWYAVAVLPAVCSAYHAARYMTLAQRLRYAARKRPTPAKPKSPLLVLLATLSAVGREASYLQWTPLRAAWWLKIPPFGMVYLVALHFAAVVALEFTGVTPDLYGDQYSIALSIKAAWLAVAQVPLLILLAGKNNLIGFVTGVSYERLNVLHRWTARVLLFLATLHMGTANYIWNEFGLRQLEWSTDACVPTGFAVWAILVWINVSAVLPLRHVSYEFFVVQHLISFFGFIIALMMHLPTTALSSRLWIYVPIALYIVDRLVRFTRFFANNAKGCRAVLEHLDGDATKIRVCNSSITNWRPGAFVLLSLPRLTPGQSHPATIASTPTSHGGDLVFILKTQRGFTRRLAQVASEQCEALVDTKHPRQVQPMFALIDGPYGHHADFAAFDSAVLVAGATGITFTLPILLDMAHRATLRRLPLRRVVFVWVVKSRACLGWVDAEVRGAMDTLRQHAVEVVVNVCVTCDEGFADKEAGPRGDVGESAACCGCDTSLGPCCCVSIEDDDDDDSDAIAPVDTASAPAQNTAAVAATSSPQPHPLTLSSGRPDIPTLLNAEAEQAQGEMAVVVCGPVRLSMHVRLAVVALSDARGVHKGSGAQGVYLHAENYAF